MFHKLANMIPALYFVTNIPAYET